MTLNVCINFLETSNTKDYYGVVGNAELFVRNEFFMNALNYYIHF